MAAKFKAVPLTDIDGEGRFKYILIKVYGKEETDGIEPSKLIVCIQKRAQQHADIYDEVSDSIRALELDTDCASDGRNEHFSERITQDFIQLYTAKQKNSVDKIRRL